MTLPQTKKIKFQLTRSRGAWRVRPGYIIVDIDDFNSHAHVERDTSLYDSDWVQEHFNSHAHVERDAVIYFLICYCQDFNSHAHVERDV